MTGSPPTGSGGTVAGELHPTRAMPPRLYVDHAFSAGLTLTLPAGASRHAQVLRLQPGSPLMLFNGLGGEWHATVLQMGRSEVRVVLGEHVAATRELSCRVTLAIGVPANERMDAVIEKATELGVHAVQPLMGERSVVRLAGERADKKVRHWQDVAQAACEQSGRTRVPLIAPVLSILPWLRQPHATASTCWLLSPGDAPGVASMPRPAGPVVCLSGPEGGWTAAEIHAATQSGFRCVSLGPRVLRADTAPLAVLAYLGIAVFGD